MKKDKNVLFVGDLRTANNYGAIATTDALNRILANHISDKAIIKYIDYRSLYLPTPVGGWPKKRKSPTKKGVFKVWIKNILPPKFFEFFLCTKDLFKMDSFPLEYLPAKFSQYEEFFVKVENEEVLQYEKELIEWADYVYINGEGNIVNGTDKFGRYRNGGLYILFIAWLSKVKFSKLTFLVNHTVDPSNEDAYNIISNLYPLLDKVLLRETLSLENLKLRGINNADFASDALFSYEPVKNWSPSKEILRQIDFTKPYICLGDSSGILSGYSKVKWDVVKVYTELISRLKDIIPQIVFIDGFNGNNIEINRVVKRLGIGRVNLTNCSYNDLFYVLKKSEIFISGRWHASILGVLANTPILLWGADSHKTRSLYTLLDYPCSFFDIKTLPIHLDDIIDSTRKILTKRDEILDIYAKKVPSLKKSSLRNASFIDSFL